MEGKAGGEGYGREGRDGKGREGTTGGMGVVGMGGEGRPTWAPPPPLETSSGSALWH